MVVSIFSVGTAAKITENYFFRKQEKTNTTLGISFAIGTEAAYGINGGSTAKVLKKLIDFGGERFKRCQKNYTPVERFGETHNEMLMKLMYRIAIMPNHVFLEKFTREFLKSDLKIEAMELGLDDSQKLSKDNLREYLFNLPGLYMHGRRSNDHFHIIQSACSQLRSVKNNSAFKAFKIEMATDLKEQQENERDSHSPLLSTMNQLIN
jgi:hypothetical protein